MCACICGQVDANITAMPAPQSPQTAAQCVGIEVHKWTYEDVIAETDRYYEAEDETQFLAAFDAKSVERNP